MSTDHTRLVKALRPAQLRSLDQWLTDEIAEVSTNDGDDHDTAEGGLPWTASWIQQVAAIREVVRSVARTQKVELVRPRPERGTERQG